MNEDLEIFEQQLKKSFVDVPLPSSLEPGRVAEALKRKPEIKVVKTPKWKRVASIAACAVLAVGVAAAAVTVMRGSHVETADSVSNDTAFDTQSSYGVGATGSESSETDEQGSILQAPTDTEQETVIVTSSLPEGYDAAVGSAIASSAYAVNATDASETARYSALAFSVIGYCERETTAVVYADVMCRDYLQTDGAATVDTERFYPAKIELDTSVETVDVISCEAYPDESYEYGAAVLLPAELAQTDYSGCKTELASRCDFDAVSYFGGGDNEA